MSAISTLICVEWWSVLFFLLDWKWVAGLIRGGSCLLFPVRVTGPQWNFKICSEFWIVFYRGVRQMPRSGLRSASQPQQPQVGGNNENQVDVNQPPPVIDGSQVNSNSQIDGEDLQVVIPPDRVQEMTRRNEA